MEPRTQNHNPDVIEALMEYLPAGVVIVDQQRRVLLANKAITQLTRLPKSGFYLDELTRLFDGQVDFGAELDKILAHAVSPVVILRDIVFGKYFYSAHCFQIFDEHSNPAGGAILFQDITREKEIDLERSEFISIASHQLRTPLGSMRWNLEMLEEHIRALPEQAQKRFYEAYKSNRRAIWLVSDLLDVARIEQGTAESEPQPTDLPALIHTVVQEMASEAEIKSLSVRTIVPDNIDKVVIDPVQFRDVIENLLLNAIKYTKAGGSITIALVKTDTGIQGSVADTGIGIPEKDQQKIFTKFFRSKNAARVHTESSGLGLFITKSYVEKWGGRLWFESKEGEGTTFYFTIPAQ